MDSVTAINTIRDNLRTNLTDPYTTAGGGRGTGVNWIFADEPTPGAKYPQLQLEKIDNPISNISISSDYWEHHQLFINVWFHTKNGFKITVDGTEYTNAQLVEYYLGQIQSTLKAQYDTLHTAGLPGYRHFNTTKVDYDRETQLYYGAVTIRVWYFKQ